MDWSIASDEYLPPVRCPKCGERQNRFSGRMTQDKSEFHRIDCMVCGRVFELEEYRDLIAEARAQPLPSIDRQN